MLRTVAQQGGYLVLRKHLGIPAPLRAARIAGAVVLLLVADPRVNGMHAVQTHPSAEQLQVRELVRAAESALRSEATDPAA
jgi:hypothetical protein